MMFLKSKILNHWFFNENVAANFETQNYTGDEIDLNKQVFVAFSKAKEINIA